MPLLLGIDIGTTGTKSIVADANGKLIATDYKAYGFVSEKAGYVEQDPEDWWSAVKITVKNCLKNCPAGDVIALSLSTQGATLVPVDRRGEKTRNAVVWMDSRAGRIGKNLNEKYGTDYFYNKTGWQLANCFNLLQILWMKENEPEVFDKTYKFLSVIDYINYKLTGRFAIDITNACITQLFNIIQEDWDEDILSFCGIGREQLPEVVKTGEEIGTLTPEAAAQLGLRTDVKVISGAQDQYMAAVGNGVLSAGEALLSCGTSWCLTCILDKPLFDNKSYFAAARHAVEGLWAAFAYSPTGGAAFEWVRKNVLPVWADGELEGYGEIEKQVENIRPGSDGLTFLPHFAGMLFPKKRVDAKANIVGLDLKHTRYHIARAVMEGSVFDMKMILDALEKKGGSLGQLKALGGATKNRTWMQMAADILGVKIIVPRFADVPALGAVIAAGTGAGLFSGFLEGYKKIGPDTDEAVPDTEKQKEYTKIYEEYKRNFDLINP
jgi:xylulokinase